jgi:hypothetical protein
MSDRLRSATSGLSNTQMQAKITFCFELLGGIVAHLKKTKTIADLCMMVSGRSRIKPNHAVLLLLRGHYCRHNAYGLHVLMYVCDTSIVFAGEASVSCICACISRIYVRVYNCSRSLTSYRRPHVEPELFPM